MCVGIFTGGCCWCHLQDTWTTREAELTDEVRSLSDQLAAQTELAQQAQQQLAEQGQALQEVQQELEEVQTQVTRVSSC